MNTSKKLILSGIVIFLLTLTINNKIVTNNIIPALAEYTLLIITLSYFNHNKKTKIALSLIYSIIVGIQLVSLYNTGNTIIPLTFSNLEEYSAIGTSQQNKIAIEFILFSAIIIATSLSLAKRTPTHKKNIIITIPCIIFLITASHGLFFNFFITLKNTINQNFYTPCADTKIISKRFLKYGFWQEDMPSEYKTSKKNIIIIFTEGFSERILDSSNHLGLKLTPNMDNLIDNSLYIKNYYNHTAATYRALRGQLVSFYQYKDGLLPDGHGFEQKTTKNEIEFNYKNRLISLPEILKKHDYSSYFIASTSNESNLNIMLETLNFDHVYGASDFKYKNEERMTDKQTFQSLSSLLKNQEKNLTKKPFLIGVYPSGTHYGLDSPDIKYGNGSNSYYNKFYNYDYQLGKFLQYFTHSSYFNNTILIITSDHATFPNQDYRKHFHTDTDLFIDKIPMIIYAKDIKPSILDAQNKNSLALAPTILNLININDGFNYFLGCSLFDSHCQSSFSNISTIGDEFYSLSNHGVSTQVDDKTIEKIKEAYTLGG